jgi:hypothetical protein
MHMHVLHEVRGRASITTTTVYVLAKREAVELATLESVSWFNHHCPAEASRLYTADRSRSKLQHATEQSSHPGLTHTNRPYKTRGGSHSFRD